MAVLDVLVSVALSPAAPLALKFATASRQSHLSETGGCIHVISSRSAVWVQTGLQQ